MKLAFITGSRAEYGYSEPLIKKLHKDPFFDLHLIVTGAHLSYEFGYTVQDIKYPIADEIECILASNTSVGISKALGLAVMGFAESYARLKPDLVFLTGDRFEMLAAGLAAHIANIPCAHNGGGELTEGAYDDAFRHSITKLSQLHFVSTDIYRDRVIQLGEQPDSVFNVGALEIEGLIPRINYKKTYKIVLAYYRATLTLDKPVSFELPNGFKYILIKPNPDVGGFTSDSPLLIFNKLSRADFHKHLLHSDALIGNSSAGLMDSPALGIPSINIGDRQRGRLKASSVIDCEPTKESIQAAFDKLYSKEFQDSLKDIKNPYKGGNVSGRIIEILKEKAQNLNLKKQFYNLPRL